MQRPFRLQTLRHEGHYSVHAEHNLGGALGNMNTTAVLVAFLVAVVLLGGHRPAAAQDALRKTEDIRIRDPFILPVPEEQRYYMYGTTRAMPHGDQPACFETFVSKDLQNWEGPIAVFKAGEGFWGTRDFWAPEVHRYKGKYYLFGTFSADKVLRATQILVSDSPRGPFQPLTDRPITPFGWQCLDGTLFIDDDEKPWIVFCHEWEQVGDGTICAMRLTDDLKYTAGPPVLLFKASEAPWITRVPWLQGEENENKHITDGPAFYRTKGGQLLMLWSSFSDGRYVQALARSESGSITGPWKQDADLIYSGDGGHGMVFRTFDGQMMLSLHSPNGGANERARFFPIEETGNTLKIKAP